MTTKHNAKKDEFFFLNRQGKHHEHEMTHLGLKLGCLAAGGALESQLLGKV